MLTREVAESGSYLMHSFALQLYYLWRWFLVIISARLTFNQWYSWNLICCSLHARPPNAQSYIIIFYYTQRSAIYDQILQYIRLRIRKFIRMSERRLKMMIISSLFYQICFYHEIIFEMLPQNNFPLTALFRPKREQTPSHHHLRRKWYRNPQISLHIPSERIN